MTSPTIDLVLPCYNPIAKWQRTVIEAFRGLVTTLPDESFRLIVVNDGSTTQTWVDGLDQLRKEIPDSIIVDRAQNGGKGQALREGLSRSNARYCIFTDVDFPYTQASLISVLERLKKNESDIVIGQRPESYYESVPLPRLILSKSFRAFLRLIYELQFRDTQCGLKGFNDVGRRAFLETETNRYLVDLEFLLLASSRKLRIDAVHVELRKGIVFSKLGIMAIGREITSLLSILYRVFLNKRAAL